jgi:hypothetical protein
MRKHLSLTGIGHLNDSVHVVVADLRTRLRGCHLIDVRINHNEAKGGYAQSGTAEGRDGDAEICMDIASGLENVWAR